VSRYLLGDKSREARRQRLALLRLERQFRPMVQSEIARASNGMIQRFAASGQMREDERHQAELETILRRMYAASVVALGEQVITQGKNAGRINERKDFSQHFARMAQQYFATWGARRVVQISDTTRNVVARAIARGYAEGLGQRGVADFVRALVPQTYRGRAEAIARTETHSAASFGAQEAAKETGLPLMREWVSAEDERTREDHAQANGQRVGLEDPFEVGDALLMYPGDPSGPPEHVVNCRCVTTFVVMD
jgi:uncharacterized protein with gpF-like domain